MRTRGIVVSVITALLLAPVGPIAASAVTILPCPQPPGVACASEATFVEGIAALDNKPPRPPVQHGEYVFVLGSAVTGIDAKNVPFTIQSGFVRITPSNILFPPDRNVTRTACRITEVAVVSNQCTQATLACEDQSIHVVDAGDPGNHFQGGRFDGIAVRHGFMRIGDPVLCPRVE